MNIKCILFDSDGVVAETDSLYFEINSELMQSLGIKHTRNDYIKYSFNSNLGSAGFLKQNHIKDIDDFKIERNRLFIQKVQSRKPIAVSTLNAISKLHKRFTIGIVTNADSETFDSVYKNSTILDLVDLVITREKYKKPKSAPDCYLKAIQELDINQGLRDEISVTSIQLSFQSLKVFSRYLQSLSLVYIKA